MLVYSNGDGTKHCHLHTYIHTQDLPIVAASASASPTVVPSKECRWQGSIAAAGAAQGLLRNC